MRLYWKDAVKSLLPVAALAVYWFWGAGAIVKNSVTYDETVHITAGHVAFKERNFEFFGWDHPPLTEMVAAAPISLDLAGGSALLPVAHPSYAKGIRYQFSDLFIFQNRLDAGRMVTAARWAVFAVFSVLAVFCVWKVAGMLHPQAGPWALLFFISEPNMLAHATLATTDFGSAALCLAGFLTVLSYAKRPTYIAAVGLGLAMIALVAAKHTNVIALPVYAALFYLLRKDPGLKELRPGHLGAGVAAGTALLCVVYLGTDPSILFKGIWSTFNRANAGRSS